MVCWMVLERALSGAEKVCKCFGLVLEKGGSCDRCLFAYMISEEDSGCIMHDKL